MLIKLAIRNLIKNKGFSILNILGLTIGITCSLLIFQYVVYEKTFESFHENAGRIVRLRMDFHDQGKLTMQSATVYPGIGPAMKREFPEVENYCRLIDTKISWGKNDLVQNNVIIYNEERDTKAIENKGFYADQSFLSIFTLDFISGFRVRSLDAPDKIILSESMSRKYFGDEPALGKKLTVIEGGNTYHYIVSGVFRDYPPNSHLSFDYLVSYTTLVSQFKSLQAPQWTDPETSFSWYDHYIYLLLKPGTDFKLFQAKVTAFADRHMNDEYRRQHNNRQDLSFIPMQYIHLRSHDNEEAGRNGDAGAVNFLYTIAFIIIIIAWINYINLATTRSLERAREVGMRKVLGALKRDLVRQFLMESLLLNFIAVILAVTAAFFLTPYFNRLTGRESAMGFYLPLSYGLRFLSVFFAGAFLSGIYPAFILSSYQPITVLKGLFKNSFKGMAIRKGMITGQFTISIILISTTIIVFRQLDFMRTRKLGADMSQTLVINGFGADQDGLYKNSFLPFKEEVMKINGVKNITASSSVMGKEIYMTEPAVLLDSTSRTSLTFSYIFADYDFLSSYGMKFLAGRNFSENFSLDKKAVIINEEALKLFGIKNAAIAINEKISNFRDTMTIIGVIANYHQLGLNKPIPPVIFIPKLESGNFYSIKLRSQDVRGLIGTIGKCWSRYFPARPFSYFFLDDSFNSQYKADEQFGKIFRLFSFLAILLASFGLLSLSAYNVLQRTREIGIRKILGASVSSIMYLISKDFLVLIIIALMISIPAGWLVMSKWLNNYAYRTGISWWIFAISGLIAITVALLTIVLQALKTVLSRPSDHLRTE